MTDDPDADWVDVNTAQTHRAMFSSYSSRWPVGAWASPWRPQSQYQRLYRRRQALATARWSSGPVAPSPGSPVASSQW